MTKTSTGQLAAHWNIQYATILSVGDAYMKVITRARRFETSNTDLAVDDCSFYLILLISKLIRIDESG